MSRLVQQIAARLSLRQPQRESLELLDRVATAVPLGKSPDLGAALEAVKRIDPGGKFTSFERDFPSLCFALATGVGKTRLMGAFIAHLFQAKGWRHFFVLAPNLTIYEKLIADFTPGTPKYVFQGLAEFAREPPEIITGDDYETGRATRLAPDLLAGPIQINVFNIAKINSEVRGGREPRIHRRFETMYEPYFQYLAGLPDLVLLMDESHRYRAEAGMAAINELKPVLGLELTATPFVTRGATITPFQNVLYEYPLARALADGFIKTPAVGTRENFDASQYSADDPALDRLKLEDGLRFHEATKVELATYALERQVKRVKPFMLVVTRDIAHAKEIEEFLQSDALFGGAYRGKVARVDSQQGAAEKDENVRRLLAVEDPDEPTEIVVHVDKLKEGWDVTNLYTIVPLRAANARVLVEQSIGRGLRLPYGTRTGVPAVDRLTIVAHDKFKEIIDDANKPDSVLKVDSIVLGRDVPMERRQTVVVAPVYEQLLGTIVSSTAEGATNGYTPLLSSPTERRAAQLTLDIIRAEYERSSQSADLRQPAVQATIAARVTQVMPPTELDLEDRKAAIVRAVSTTINEFTGRTIDIPRIILVPTSEVEAGFEDFDLDCRNLNYPPVAETLVGVDLDTQERFRIDVAQMAHHEKRIEDHLVHRLIDFDDIAYDHHADLLYKLCGQAVSHLRARLKNDDEVRNVVVYHRQAIANLIHAQMRERFRKRATGFEAKVSRGFQIPRQLGFDGAQDELHRPFRQPLDDRSRIGSMVFTGFKRCVYPKQKFSSDTERQFAILLEDDADASLLWMKPARGQFQIEYRNGEQYEPDFVVETSTRKLLIETKAARDLDSEEVKAKAAAAITWCGHATDHAKQHGGKAWTYVLIPHDAVAPHRTLTSLVDQYAR